MCSVVCLPCWLVKDKEFTGITKSCFGGWKCSIDQWLANNLRNHWQNNIWEWNEKYRVTEIPCSVGLLEQEINLRLRWLKNNEFDVKGNQPSCTYRRGAPRRTTALTREDRHVWPSERGTVTGIYLFHCVLSSPRARIHIFMFPNSLDSTKSIEMETVAKPNTRTLEKSSGLRGHRLPQWCGDTRGKFGLIHVTSGSNRRLNSAPHRLPCYECNPFLLFIILGSTKARKPFVDLCSAGGKMFLNPNNSWNNSSHRASAKSSHRWHRHGLKIRLKGAKVLPPATHQFGVFKHCNTYEYLFSGWTPRFAPPENIGRDVTGLSPRPCSWICGFVVTVMSTVFSAMFVGRLSQTSERHATETLGQIQGPTPDYCTQTWFHRSIYRLPELRN